MWLIKGLLIKVLAMHSDMAFGLLVLLVSLPVYSSMTMEFGSNSNLNEHYHEICKRYKVDMLKKYILEELGLDEPTPEDVVKRVPKYISKMLSDNMNADCNKRYSDAQPDSDSHSFIVLNRTQTAELAASSTITVIVGEGTSNDELLSTTLSPGSLRNMSRIFGQKKSMQSTLQSLRQQHESTEEKQIGIIDLRERLAARPVQLIMNAMTNSLDNQLPSDPQRIFFNVDGLTSTNIQNATLLFHVRKPDFSVSSSVEVNVHVYRYINPTEVAAAPLISRTFKILRSSAHDQKHISVHINLTALVMVWMRTPKKNYGIMIVTNHDDSDLVNRKLDNMRRFSHIFLNIEFNSKPNALLSRRKKTNVKRKIWSQSGEDTICSLDQNEERCCRYPLTVDFQTMGWDWILSPKRYNAFYCAGTCPFLYKQSSGHTHLTQQAELLSGNLRKYRSVGPCCSPQEYRDLKILYISPFGTVHERMVPGMVVTRCGCA